MDSGTPDILMVSAMPPMAATFIFMASSCPRHLFGHLGKTSRRRLQLCQRRNPARAVFTGEESDQ